MAAVLLAAGCRKQEGTSRVRVNVNDFTITEGMFPTRGEEPVYGQRDENPHDLRCWR